MKKSIYAVMAVVVCSFLLYTVNAVAQLQRPARVVNPAEVSKSHAGKFDILKGKVVHYETITPRTIESPYCSADIEVTDITNNRTVQQPVKVGRWQTSNDVEDAKEICELLEDAYGDGKAVLFATEAVTLRSKTDPTRPPFRFINVVSVSFDSFQ